MDDRRRCRGSALTSAMLLCAALIPLGLYVSLRAELDVHVQEHTRRALEAFLLVKRCREWSSDEWRSVRSRGD